MRQRTVIFIVLAVFFTVGTIFLSRSWLAREHAQVVPQTVEKQPGVSVLVAAHDLATGSFVRPEDLRWQAWPEGQVADNYLLKDKDAPEALSGAVVKLHIAAGEPVTNNRVVKPGDRGFLAAVLSPGMRAISLPVTPMSGVSGLVFPGDHVDVILSHQVKNPTAEGGEQMGSASETVLTDIRLLAIDQSTADIDGKPILAKTVTFEVTPKQVEAIEVASTLGNLYLSLRGLAGSDTPDTEDQVSADGSASVRSVSHTWDSDVSPLIRHGASGLATVTILRGDGTGSTTVTVPAAKAGTSPAGTKTTAFVSAP